MRELNEQKLARKSKIQNINCGVSTKNFVATQELQKKWLKVKQTSIRQRQLQETYFFNAILDPAKLKQNKSSLISLQNISIEAKLKKEEGKAVVLFYLERPFANMTLVDTLGRKSRQEEHQFVKQFDQVFSIFLENASLQLPLLIPSNFLLNKTWGQHFQMTFNYTSLVGFQLFLQKGDIFTSKFKQFSAYLHPRIFDYNTQQLNVSFQSKLYTLALLTITIIFKKSFSIPYSFEKYQNTINFRQAQQILEINHKEILLSLEKKILWDHIKQKIKSDQLRLILSKFIKKAIIYPHTNNSSKDNNQVFRCWKDVINHFNPHLLTNYMKSLAMKSQKYDYLIKELFKSQTQQNIKYYKKMGIIGPQLTSFQDAEELIVYFMLKVDGLQCIKNILENRTTKICPYQPKKYSTLKKLIAERRTAQLQSISNQRQSRVAPEKKQPEDVGNCQIQQIELSFEKELNQSLNFNVFSFQLQAAQTQNPKKIIFVPNEYQKTLDIYGSRLWL